MSDTAIEALRYSEFPNNSDAISRQAAIDAVNSRKTAEQCKEGEVRNWTVDACVDRIKQLPPIQPKRGRWIYCEDSTADCVDGYRCDQCGFFVPWDYKHKGIDFIQDYNFCPNCGADMRQKGENSESN